jgi:hypothetical protein
MLRPVGIRSIASRLSTEVFAADVTSTTGEAPVTVMVSSSWPTPSSALSVAVNSDGSWRPSRRKVLKPVNENVTV